MKKDSKQLIKENIILLIPLILYGIYKNGFLVYQKGLISFISVFKPLLLVLVSIGIKLVYDYIFYKKFKVDYNLVYAILIGMIMPFNINVFVYILLFSIFYLLFKYIDKYFKVNKVCAIYLLIIGIHFIFNDFTFLNTLELNYSFSFDFLDYLCGRGIGSISTTSILLSLIAFCYLVNTYYYKKDIPFVINLTYLFLSFLYFVLTNNSSLLLNSELIFSSIFVASLPEYSPYKVNVQIIYGILIGIITFIISVLFNFTIAPYIAIFIVSILNLLLERQNMTK